MRKIKLFLIVTLLLSSFLPAMKSPALALSNAEGPAPSAPRSQVEAVNQLWLDVSLGPPLVEWFNQVARPDDIARVERVEEIGRLDGVTVGQKLVVFKSAAEAERLIPTIANQVDVIGYNLEQGPANPADEQADPVRSARRLQTLAQRYGLKLAFGPDHDLALSHGVAVAPYVDIFVLQVQRVQTEPDTVRDFVLPLASQLRQANPDLEISVQIRTEGNVDRLVDLIDSMKTSLDGVSILTSPETVETAMALITALQTRTTAAPEAVATLAVPQAAPATVQNVRPTWLHVAGALIAGVIGGAVTTALLCSSRARARHKQVDYD